MPSPFPGMDPYLEGPLWTGFHTQFCVEIARNLMPRLLPRYLALTEKRFVVTTVGEEQEERAPIYPDTAIVGKTGEGAAQESELKAPLRLATIMPEKVPQVSIEIREAESRRLVTAIEMLSPANKRGEGREEYLAKRDDLLLSNAHLIEIDLLRGGERVPMREPLPSAPYFVLVSRVQSRPIVEVWPIALGSKLPGVPVPLLAGDADVELDLQKVFDSVYDSFGYSAALNYSRKLQPAVAGEELDWINARLAQVTK